MRVGRPCFPILSYTERDARRKRQQAGKKNRRRKRPPTHPRDHGENTGKTRQGEPTNPERRHANKAGGRENVARGTPPTQRETEQAPLDAGRKNQQNAPKSLGGSTLSRSFSLKKCEPSWQRPRWARQSSKKQKHKITKTQLLNPVVSQSS